MAEGLCPVCLGRKRLAGGQNCPLCSPLGQGTRFPEQSGRSSYFFKGVFVVIAAAAACALVVRACVWLV